MPTLAINEVRKCQNWFEYSQLASDWFESNVPFCKGYIEVWMSLESLVQLEILNPTDSKDFKQMKSIVKKFLDKNKECQETIQKRDEVHDSWKQYNRIMKMRNLELAS